MATISIYVNHKETVDLCTKYNCLDSELNKVLKATILDHKTSRYYREFEAEQKVDKESIIEDFIRNTQPAEFVIRQQELLSKVKFTPNL